jgi:hypothetical protein
LTGVETVLGDGLTMEVTRGGSPTRPCPGVLVRASGGEEIGTVEHVLEVPELDVFDGIVVKTPGGLRFADADQVADITDRYVVLNLPVEDTEWLGGPQAPAVYHADPSEHAGGSLHDWLGRRFGRRHWNRER